MACANGTSIREVDRLLSAENFQKCLTTRTLGRNFMYLDSTTSAMDVVYRAADQGATSGLLVASDFQASRGHGVLRGMNLLFTLLLIVQQDVMRLPMIAATAVAAACRQRGANAYVKWPSDVWIGDKRVAGVSVESRPRPPVDSSDSFDSSSSPGDSQLVWVGINVNRVFARGDPMRVTSTSLKEVLGTDVRREWVLAAVCNAMEPMLSLSFEETMARFIRYDMLVGRRVVIARRNDKKTPVESLGDGTDERADTSVGSSIVQTGTAKGFTKDGSFQVLLDEGPSELTTLSASDGFTVRPVEHIDLPLLVRGDVGETITGLWKNQLGSTVKFHALSQGVLDGQYNTSVGNARDGQLRGWYSSTLDGGALMGWSVSWCNPIGTPYKSMAGWVGRLRLDPDTGKPRIETTWNLAHEEATPKDDWKMFTENKDVFSKLGDEDDWTPL